MSTLDCVYPGGAERITMIFTVPAPIPRFVTVSPFKPGPRSFVVAPNITLTLSAFSLSRNETMPLLLVTSHAYGVAQAMPAIDKHPRVTRVEMRSFFMFGLVVVLV